jgi:hypothetical protein
MYVLFMLASPLALTIGLSRGGWFLVIGVSMALWLLAQFGLSQLSYNIIMKAVDLKVPLHQTGAFEMVAWQFMWILGMWMGSRREAVPAQRDFPGWLIAACLVIGIGCMVWRHAVGLAPFGSARELNLLFDKWSLGPLRVLNFLALLVIVVRFGPWLAGRVRLTWLETLGRASLPVFCAQIVAVLVVLSAIGDKQGGLPLWADTLLLGSILLGLYGVALFSNRLDREQRLAVAPARLSARTAG